MENAAGCVQPYSYSGIQPFGGSNLVIDKVPDIVTVNFDENIVDDNEGDPKDWKVTNDGDGTVVWLVPLWADVRDVYPSADLEGLGVEACDVVAEYSTFAVEVPLSRLNLGRAPIKVLQQQYAEVTDFLSTATSIGLDPAGRLTADGVAIDSSPMNQSVFYELLVNRELVAKDRKGKVIGSEFGLPGGYSYLEIAAMALGGAADKSTSISIDTVAYLNRINGITDFGPPETFYDFAVFSYDRSATYDGCLTVIELDVNGYPLPETTDTVMELVFESEAASGVNIDGFAQWADDARKVNLYLHDAASVLAADPVGSTEVCPIAPTSPAP